AFPARLQTLLRRSGYDVQVANAGIPGDTLRGMLVRLDRYVPQGTRVVIVRARRYCPGSSRIVGYFRARSGLAYDCCRPPGRSGTPAASSGRAASARTASRDRRSLSTKHCLQLLPESASNLRPCVGDATHTFHARDINWAD